jgi:apolipoprotein N-acyltransferase
MQLPIPSSLARLGARFRPYVGGTLAFAAGALAVLGFAPFGYFWVAVLAVLLLNAALDGATAAQGLRRGWLFGLGLLGFGIAWIRISLNEYGNMPAWAADLVMVLFVIGMAFYYALASWFYRLLARGPSWTGPVMILPGLLVLCEWLRGWLMTGFPWLLIGYTQIDGPLAGYAPALGVYGLSLVVTVTGGLFWALPRWSNQGRMAGVITLVLLWFVGHALERIEWTRPKGEPFTATVIQANIPQAIKWNPNERVAIIETYVDLTLPHLATSDLIVWPETAVPDFADQVREFLLDPLAERVRTEGVELVLGIPAREPETRRYYNGLLAIGTREDFYAKRHLVPFGEFIPFKSWLGPLGEMFEVPMSDFSAGDRPRPQLMVGKWTAGAAICYEDIFPAEVAAALPEAEFLVSVSNDAWFGDSLAPHQHLEMARMRALETGRDLVRATNTGISAIVDWRGRVVGRIPPFERSSLTGQVQPRAGATPFVREGNRRAIGLACLLVLGAPLLRRRRRAS